MSNLPDWAKGLVSPDIEWEADTVWISTEIDGRTFKVTESGMFIRIESKIPPSYQGGFPSPAHAIHAAETMIRCLRGDALPSKPEQPLNIGGIPIIENPHIPKNSVFLTKTDEFGNRAVVDGVPLQLRPKEIT